MAVSRIPPMTVRETARRAVAWIAEGLAGDGFTDGARARARRLAAGAEMPVEWFTLAPAWFARHEVDAQAEGWNAGEEGFPSPGRVAWDAWGGDAGRAWAEKIRDLIAVETDADEARAIILDDETMLEDDTLGELLDGITVDSLEGPTWTARQAAIYASLELIRDEFGAFDKGTGPNGIHYVDADENPFVGQGLICSGCAFYDGGGACELLAPDEVVQPYGVCKFWVIPAGQIVEDDPTEEPADA